MERKPIGTRTATGAALLVMASLIVATTLSGDDHSAALAQDEFPVQDARIFAKFDGIDGESKDDAHPKWVHALRLEWGGELPRNRHGSVRRRASAVVHDLALTVEYDKATPKLQEKCLKGAVIPKLEIEHTGGFGELQFLYLRYELKNVQVTSYQVHAPSEMGPPISEVTVQFEEVKVTYTEYDDEGHSKGNVEYLYRVE